MSNQSENKFNILLAEDDLSNQLLLERMFNIAGHYVTIANNGREALDYLDANSYDICIFDMQMPVMSGIDAVKLYKSDHPESQLPFIILTANTELHSIEECKKAGADLHLTKPIIYNVLSDAINTLCKNNNQLIASDNDFVIDVTQLDYFEDPVFMDKFIEIFEDSSEKLARDLNSVLENNYEPFMKVIHSIKGLSGNIGAHHLREKTIAAEGISEHDYTENSKEYYTIIVDELFRARDELVKFSSSSKLSK